MVYFYSNYDVFVLCLYTKSPLLLLFMLLYSTPGRDEEGWRRTEAGGAKGHSATRHRRESPAWPEIPVLCQKQHVWNVQLHRNHHL